jgi:cyanophycinase
MKKRIVYFLPVFLIIALLLGITSSFNVNTAKATSSYGGLVIVGGGLSDDNAAVFQKMIELSGGSNSRIGVIPVNSADPYGSYDYYEERFLYYGAGEVVLIDITENNYQTNAYSQEIVNLINTCTGIWFTGGDQLRAKEALIDDNGDRTPALQAIWDVYSSGAAIGGTSAGAALMSDPMIIGGYSFEALLYGSSWGEGSGDGVLLEQGLGFFNRGMVDQHFNARGRIGRLIRAAWDCNETMAFGVDEDTAMVVEDNIITAIGKRGVTILDFSNATQDTGNSRFNLADVKMHFISKGDTFNLDTKEITPNPIKFNLAGQEYYYGEIYTNDVFGEYKAYDCFVELVDSQTETEATGEKYDRRLKKGYRLKWYRTAETEGYWERIDGDSSYTVINEDLEVIPY